MPLGAPAIHINGKTIFDGDRHTPAGLLITRRVLTDCFGAKSASCIEGFFGKEERGRGGVNRYNSYCKIKCAKRCAGDGQINSLTNTEGWEWERDVDKNLERHQGKWCNWQ